MPRDLSRFPRVCLVADPSRLGRLVESGPYQSVVHWDDDGNEAVVINGWVRKLDPVLATEVLAPTSPAEAGQKTRTVGAIPATGANKPKRAAPPDDLVARLRDAEPRRLEAFARRNDVWDERYASLPNVGLIRMNVINRLRAKVKKGHEIKWLR